MHPEERFVAAFVNIHGINACIAQAQHVLKRFIKSALMEPAAENLLEFGIRVGFAQTVSECNSVHDREVVPAPFFDFFYDIKSKAPPFLSTSSVSSPPATIPQR